MKNYLFRSAEGRDSITSIVESAFFVNSKVEEGIQLADLAAGIIRKYHELLFSDGANRDMFTDWLENLYSQIQRQTINLPSHIPAQQLFGIYKMPTRLLLECKREAHCQLTRKFNTCFSMKNAFSCMNKA